MGLVEVSLQPYFNPRSREGSDHLLHNLEAVRHVISIHAPAKGATIPWPKSFHFSSNFNPRSREGSDIVALDKCYIHLNFNPRSREGSDAGSEAVLPLNAISIHAPAKGATVFRQDLTLKVRFQSTLPRRERLRCLLLAVLSV